MLISRASPRNPFIFVVIFTMALLVACNKAEEPSRNDETLASKVEQQTQEELEQTEIELQHTQRQLSETKQKAESAIQSSAFLKGALISGIIVALIIGIGLGSKAKHESLQQKEESMNDEPS